MTARRSGRSAHTNAVLRLIIHAPRRRTNIIKRVSSHHGFNRSKVEAAVDALIEVHALEASGDTLTVPPGVGVVVLRARQRAAVELLQARDAVSAQLAPHDMLAAQSPIKEGE